MHLRFITRTFVASSIALFTDHRLAVSELTFRPRLAKPSRLQLPSSDNRALLDQDICNAFQADISNKLGARDPDHLSNTIRTIPVSVAKNVLPRKTKPKFPVEFSAQTIDLIHRKRKLWKFLQKSGQQITRSMHDIYRSLRRDTKRSISVDRIALLEKEAYELADAFKQNRFKGTFETSTPKTYEGCHATRERFYGPLSCSLPAR
jgi:hypothetical protein